MDKIYLLIGNDTPLAVCLRKSEGEETPVPYDLSEARHLRLTLVGHGMRVCAKDIEVSGDDNNVVSGMIPGRSLLKGDYDLEVTFTLDGRDKRFAIDNMFEAVDFLAEDADGEAEGEGAGIFLTVTVQPELIEISGPTGPQGKSAYQVWLDDGHTGTEDDFFEWLAAQTPNPDWNQNDSTKADFIKNRTHWEEESSTTINDAKLAWSGSTPETLDFWLYGTDVHIPRTSVGWGLTWEGGELFIDDMGTGYELGVFDGEEWEYNPFDPSFDQQPYPLNVDVVIASETVHKLDNKYLDLDSTPALNSQKPITSDGVKRALNAIPTVPVISTNVEADGTSDTKTSSPKSVKTFVEGKGYYTKPQSGIPASDIAAGVIPTVPTDIVKYTSQSLTDAQKEQARTNIGAADESEVSQLRSEKADKDGYYPEMSVGSLKGTEVTQVEGITAIAKSTGIAKINEVMGKSLVWNQLVQNGDFSDGLNHWNQSGVVATVNADDVTIHATSESYTAQNFNQALPTISGHKYLLSYIYKSDTVATAYFANANGVSLPASESFVEQKQIMTSSGYGVLRFYPSTGAQYSPSAIFTLKKHIVAFDLTQLFGSGNEPSTVAEFESWLANNIGYRDYYAYNPGEIISNNTEALEITGLNQLNLEGRTKESPNCIPSSDFSFLTEEYVLKGFATNGYVNVGNIAEYSLSANQLYVKTSTGGSSAAYGLGIPVKVQRNTTYCIRFTKQSSSSVVAVVSINERGEIIGSISANIQSGTTFNTGDAVMIAINFKPNAINTAATFTDICLSISGSRNGEYEPYQKSELELNLATITGKLNGEGESVVIFPDGMRLAGTAFDSLIVDEDGWCRRAVRRLAEVDLGTLTWFAANPETSTERQSSNSLQSILAGAEATAIANLLSTKYIAVSANSTYLHQKDMSIAAVPSGTIFVYDSSLIGHTAEEIKSAMSGVLLYYELATPLEYVLDTPIQMTFQAKHGGVIRQLPENGSAPNTAPMRMSVTYALPPEALMSEGSIRNMLEALKSAGIINTYTMAWDYTIGKWTFSFT